MGLRIAGLTGLAALLAGPWSGPVAWGFSSAPPRACVEDAGCVLVREIHCGKFSAVTLGEDAAWAKFEARERAKDVAAGRVCPPGPRPDVRKYEARCVQKECVAVEKGRE